jgi:hypothetical protein
MSVLRCPYQILVGEAHLLPICNLQLIGPRGRISVQSLLDTGAVYSIFPAKAAEDAGLALSPFPNFTVQYGGSTALGRKMRVDVLLGEHRWRPDVVFVEHLAFRYALLGRLGVFARFAEVAFLEQLKTPRVEFRM